MTRYGIFTDRQREYLQGEKTDLDPGDERSLRRDIRERVDTAFAEFYLFSKLSATDRRQVFEEKLVYTEDDPMVKGGAADAGRMKRDQSEWETGGGEGLAIGFMHLLRFTYTGFREQGYDPDRLGSFIRYAAVDAECELNEDLERGDVVVTFDVETVPSVDVEVAEGKYERGEDLSAVELKALVDHGYLAVHGP